MAKNNFKRALGAGFALAITGALCVFLILYASLRTQDLIAKNNNERINTQVAKLLPLKSDVDFSLECRLLSDPRVGQNMRVLKATQEGQEVGTIMLFATSRGYSNPLILVGGFDSNQKIHRIDIALSKETPGLGDKVDRKHGNFLEALNGLGKDDANFEVKKFGGDFDYITGATVTSRAIILASHDALEALHDLDFKNLPQCRN